MLFRVNVIDNSNDVNTILFPLNKVCYINYYNNKLLISFDNKESITISGKEAEKVFIELVKAMEK